MSRIYDAIRDSQEERSRRGASRSDSLGEMELPERRITPRIDLNVDLTVYGRSDCDAVFYEPVKAIRGNANGGSFLLEVPVLEGQELLLINNDNSQEQVCKVMAVRVGDTLACEVSVSFPVPNFDFWKTLQN